jgi:hypothetical protein
MVRVHIQSLMELKYKLTQTKFSLEVMINLMFKLVEIAGITIWVDMET